MDYTDIKALAPETVSDEADLTSLDEVDISAFPTASPAASSLLVLDKHIVHAALYNRKPTLLRLDLLPFLALYALLLLAALPALQYELTAIVTAEPAVVTPAPLLAIARNDTDDDELLSASASFDEVPLGSAEDVVAGEPSPPLWHFIAMYALPVAAILHALAFLSAYWSMRFNSALRYDRQPMASLATAQLIRVLPALHCGAPALCPLERTVIDSQPTTQFTYQKTKYLLTTPPASAAQPASPTAFIPLSYPTTNPLSSYLSYRGHTAATAASALSKYGANVFDIQLASFWDLYAEHAVAPFFLFQIFCVLLWCLDEYWYYSLMTLFMLVSFEGTVVKRRQKHLEYVRDMRVPPYKVWVCRDGRWEERLTSDIVPGDVVSMVRTAGEGVVPCDMLLLAGQCVVNEALLTGESVPQVKEAIDLQDGDQPLNINKQHKRHTLYGGTKILLTSHKSDDDAASTARSAVKPASDGGCVCYALKTGFASSQGRLVRTILYSTERVSVNNSESLLFILFLLVFALAAAAYVLYHGLNDPSRSRYRLMLNTIMIITSVVPPELPMELSLAVNTSLMQLAQQQIFCTEPFRIPLAGAIDVCCFDKTGTLTADEFRVSGVAGLSESKEGGEGGALMDANDVRSEVKYVIAGCHSLAHIADAGLVGDPLEKAAFDAIRWTYNKADVAASSDGKQKVKVLHRFAFTSALKRMSCVVSVEGDGGGNALRCVVKGAAEVLEPMFAALPPQYARCHQHWARQGCRVLAMGYKVLPLRDTAEDRRKVRELRRDDVEGGLTFAGFLVLSCPLKWDTVAVVRHLLDSSHDVVMITGDNTLTATSVARELTMVTRTVAILTHTAERVEWLDVDGQLIQPFDLTVSGAALSALVERYDLCVSGDAMEYLMVQLRVPTAQLATLFPYVRVFARTSPDQKELILTQMKLAGRVTLMVGDGSNDVGYEGRGKHTAKHTLPLLISSSPLIVMYFPLFCLFRLFSALKHAHVGIALVGKDESDKKRKEIAEAEQKALTQPNTVAAKPAAQPSKWQQMMQLSRKVQTEQQAAEQASGRKWTSAEQKQFIQQRFAAEVKALTGPGGATGAVGEEAPQIRLGDASIASPFTSKVPYISSAVHIVRQGRCTLVTTLQMFAILGVNSLINAYSMSVLYLDGVKMGDVQMTFSGLSIAMMFLFVSRSKPVDRLSAERPPSRLFTAHMMLNIMGQFALHLGTLYTAVQLSNPHTARDTETRSTDTAFKPNVLNTVVYLVSTMMTTATFFANYRGRPFMEGLRENVWLWRVLILNVAVVLLLASGVAPQLNEWMQLVPMPSAEMHWQLMGLVLFDLCSTVALANALKRVFAIKPPKRRGGAAGGASKQQQQRLKAE